MPLRKLELSLWLVDHDPRWIGKLVWLSTESDYENISLEIAPLVEDLGKNYIRFVLPALSE